MAKIVKITEGQLTEMINRIISENELEEMGRFNRNEFKIPENIGTTQVAMEIKNDVMSMIENHPMMEESKDMASKNLSKLYENILLDVISRIKIDFYAR